MPDPSLVPTERIERAILVLRGHKVMLDSDLAVLYGVMTKVLNQAVSRNIERFPEDFMFQLTEEEAIRLRSQIVTLKTGRGQHRKYLPYAFTEQGVAMLSSVLRSPGAVQVNIEIMRAFVRLRELIATNKGLARRLDELEKKYDAQFKVVFDAIRQLMAPPEKARRSPGARKKESRCACRMSLSPRWLPGRGGKADLPQAAAAWPSSAVMGTDRAGLRSGGRSENQPEKLAIGYEHPRTAQSGRRKQRAGRGGDVKRGHRAD